MQCCVFIMDEERSLFRDAIHNTACQTHNYALHFMHTKYTLSACVCIGVDWKCNGTIVLQDIYSKDVFVESSLCNLHIILLLFSFHLSLVPHGSLLKQHSAHNKMWELSTIVSTVCSLVKSMAPYVHWPLLYINYWRVSELYVLYGRALILYDY